MVRFTLDCLSTGSKLKKTKYDKYLIDRSNGLNRFTGTTVIDSTLGIITVHGVAAALSGTARPKLGCKKNNA